ncbi:MAG TPA: efflux RND transporter periplasmic adaptor subunit [Kofleriaceae bacterium]|nr:efflux RND transporter periplasmic adaptor subunit [Kofleriaceae bacterium]
MKAAPETTEDLIAAIRHPGFAPRLISDVQIARLPDQERVRVWYDGSRKWVDLQPLDCLIAQQMDGARSLDELTRFARQYDQSIERGNIERLVIDLHTIGLVFRDSHGPGQPEPKEGKIVPLPTRRTPVDEFSALREDLVDVFSDDTTVDWQGAGGPYGRLLAGQGGAAFARPAPGPDAEPETFVQGHPQGWSVYDRQPDAVPEAEPDPEPEAPPETPSTPEAVEAEQEQLWDEMRAVKWHQRRRYRALLVLTALTLAAAVIPYPLRITSDAVIVPTERAYVRSKTGGIIASIAVDEAQKVHKGDVLARLDDRELKTEQRKAQAEIERIGAEIERLKRGARAEEIAGQRAAVSGASNEVAFARKEALRKKRMAQQGVGSAQASDQAQHELRAKQKALAEASAALRLLKAGSRHEDIDAREAELDRARAQLGFVEEQLALTVIAAPIDGVVVTPKFRERLYEKIEAGGLLCQIAQTERMRAEIYLSENDMDSVVVGQPVVVKVQSYPTREFTGKVDFLAPTVEKKDDQNRVRVVAELDNAEGLLKQDMTGYGEINSGRRAILSLVTRRLLRWVRVRFLL